MYNNKMVLQSLIHEWIDLAEVSYKPGRLKSTRNIIILTVSLRCFYHFKIETIFVLRHFQTVLRDGFFYDLIIFYHDN